MSRAQIDNYWGIVASIVEKVERALRSCGPHVKDVKQAGQSLRVVATIMAITSAFQSKLSVYHALGQREIHGGTGEGAEYD